MRCLPEIDPCSLVNSAIQQRAAQDLSKVTWVLNDTDIVNAQATAARADVALVFVSAWAAEVYDRDNLDPSGGGNALIEAVAAVNNNTIVSQIA